VEVSDATHAAPGALVIVCRRDAYPTVEVTTVLLEAAGLVDT
jgi:hypothetical protein